MSLHKEDYSFDALRSAVLAPQGFVPGIQNLESALEQLLVEEQFFASKR